MNHDVIITCALTGAGDTTAKSPHVPITPKQIAAAAVEAAKAGATVVHCHVRDPQTGKFSRDVALYREVMERIREADVDIIVNLTAGMGGDLEIGPGNAPPSSAPIPTWSARWRAWPTSRRCYRRSAPWTAAP